MLRIRPKKIGLAPGSLVHVGDRPEEPSRLSMMVYDNNALTEAVDVSVEACLQQRGAPGVTWINLDGVHDIPRLEAIGTGFGLHSLTLEDILNTDHRPKCEDFDTVLLLILKMLFYDRETERVRSEQVSVAFGAGFVLTFQERQGDVFDAVRERLRRQGSRTRERGADFLAYALVDSIVDSYYHILERLGDSLADLEEAMTDQPSRDELTRIHLLKGEMTLIRRAIWPLRDLVSGLQRDESTLVTEGTRIYLRDLYDHTIQVMDTVEIYRESLANLLDLYLSSVSQRTNEVMRVLTIMATLFIPLTFIVGVYGMNFEYMPELHWRYGYALVWGVMLVGTGAMVGYFKRKDWF